jgi:hypothetical protein
MIDDSVPLLAVITHRFDTPRLLRAKPVPNLLSLLHPQRALAPTLLPPHGRCPLGLIVPFPLADLVQRPIAHLTHLCGTAPLVPHFDTPRPLPFPCLRGFVDHLIEVVPPLASYVRRVSYTPHIGSLYIRLYPK